MGLLSSIDGFADFSSFRFEAQETPSNPKILLPNSTPISFSIPNPPSLLTLKMVPTPYNEGRLREQVDRTRLILKETPRFRDVGQQQGGEDGDEGKEEKEEKEGEKDGEKEKPPKPPTPPNPSANLTASTRRFKSLPTPLSHPVTTPSIKSFYSSPNPCFLPYALDLSKHNKKHFPAHPSTSPHLSLKSDLLSIASTTISYSSYNPPPSNRAIQGDVAYLDVTTKSDGRFGVTCCKGGFYLNGNKEDGVDDRFSPEMRDGGKVYGTILGLLVGEGVRFRKVWKRAVDESIRIESKNSRADSSDKGGMDSCDIAVKGVVQCFPPKASFTIDGDGNVGVEPFQPEGVGEGHGKDKTRAENWVMKGATGNEWNEEISLCRNMPATTPEERLARARQIYVVTQGFHDAGVSCVQGVINGTIPPVNEHDVRSRWVYVSDNIFVSTPNVEDDTYHVVRKGGEDKNTGNDVGNVAIVGKKDLDDVRFFMQVMVEIEGKRYLCQSIAPGILTGGDNQDYLEYGKVEKDGDFKSDPEVQAIVARTFGGMGMVGRWIGGVEIYGPVEMKGLKGHDGRRYFLEVTRLTPRDANWVPKEEGGTGKLESIKGKDVPTSLDDGEWTAMVLRRELVEAYKEHLVNEAREKVVTDVKAKIKQVNEDFEKEIAAKVKTYKETEEKLKEKECAGEGEKDEEAIKKKKEERENELTNFAKSKQTESHKVREDIIKAADAKEKEAVEEARKKGSELKYNVNVFLGVEPDEKSKEDWKEDEEVARKLAVFAIDYVVPKLTEAIRARGGLGVPGDGEELTDMIHNHGLNCRYLGALARKAIEMGAEKPSNQVKGVDDIGKDYPTTSVKVPGAWLDILEIEMAARAAKKVLNGYLKSDVGNKATLIASFLSALVTVGQETVGETDTREEHDGVLYEGSTEDGLQWADVWDKIRCEVGRRFRYNLTMFPGDRLCVPLLRRVLIRSGITLTARSYGFDEPGKAMKHGTFHPIRPSDILKITPMVKDSQEGGGMRAWRRGQGGGILWKDGEDGIRSAVANIQMATSKPEVGRASLGNAYTTLLTTLQGYIDIAGINSRFVLSPLSHINTLLSLAGETPAALQNMAKYLSVSCAVLGRDHYKTRMACQAVAQLTADEGVHDYAAAFLATAIGAGYMSGGDRNEDNTRDIVKIGGLVHAMNGDGFGIIEGAVSGREWGGMFDRLDALRSAGKMRAERGDAEGAIRNEGRVGEEMKRFLGPAHTEVANSVEITKGYKRTLIEKNVRIAKGEENGAGEEGDGKK
eukprot:CAMPEP_0118644686 /NCGR_PEP_ID=MMETSP0785-20121206/7081_1 /TAXON_ID=91992 /ORGANISM="Bolidomonas pacifica, Strain CCMP 1866" /LENGTH=1273 /DNA_ID=CAMNT_0006536481 /DNA_START=113 /DNA_END=3931 /DNA_ORIENTATION=-